MVKHIAPFCARLLLSLVLLIPFLLFSQTRGFKEKKIIVNDERGIPQEIKLYDNLCAVIIGVDRYQNLETNQYLRNAVSDAKGIESVLREQYPFNKIISLYNDNATRDNILKTLGDLKSQTAESDGVFIFFAGHGNTVKRVAVRKPAIYCPTTVRSNQTKLETCPCPSCVIKCRKSRPNTSCL